VSYFKEDGESVGLYDSASFNFREGWEDTDFLIRLLRKPLLIARKKEEALVHLEHEKSPWSSLKNKGRLEGILDPLVC